MSASLLLISVGVGLSALLVQLLGLFFLRPVGAGRVPRRAWGLLLIVAGQLYIVSQVPLTSVLLHLHGAMPLFACH